MSVPTGPSPREGTPPTTQGRYKTTSGGNRIRAYKPARSLLRRLRREVYARDDYTCVGCKLAFPRPPKDWDGSVTLWGSGGTYLTLDHMIPYAAGGEFTSDNLRTLCARCNFSRGRGTY